MGNQENERSRIRRAFYEKEKINKIKGRKQIISKI